MGTLCGPLGLFEMCRRVNQGEHQPGNVPEATHASEAPERAVEAVDGIGRGQGRMQGTSETHPGDGEGLAEPSAHRGFRPGMLASERTVQVARTPIAHLSRLTLEGLALMPRDLGALVLGQMREDNSWREHLPTVIDRPPAVDLGTCAAERLRPVHGEQHRALHGHSRLDQVSEYSAGHGVVLRRAFTKPQHVLGPARIRTLRDEHAMLAEALRIHDQGRDVELGEVMRQELVHPLALQRHESARDRPSRNSILQPSLGSLRAYEVGGRIGAASTEERLREDDAPLSRNAAHHTPLPKAFWKKPSSSL